MCAHHRALLPVPVAAAGTHVTHFTTIHQHVFNFDTADYELLPETYPMCQPVLAHVGGIRKEEDVRYRKRALTVRRMELRRWSCGRDIF